jgi:hypothetical protein
MTTVLPTPRIVVGTGVYKISGIIHGSVSPEAMEYVNDALPKCKSDDPSELLKIAIEAAGGNTQVLKNLYVYGRFQFAIHPTILNNLFGDLEKAGISLYEAATICKRSGAYWGIRGAKDKRTITTR